MPLALVCLWQIPSQALLAVQDQLQALKQGLALQVLAKAQVLAQFQVLNILY